MKYKLQIVKPGELWFGSALLIKETTFEANDDVDAVEVAPQQFDDFELRDTGKRTYEARLFIILEDQFQKEKAHLLCSWTAIKK